MVDGKETIVGGWRIAVECRLKMVEHNQLGVNQGWYSRFKETVFGKSQDTTKTIKHVVLDVDCESRPGISSGMTADVCTAAKIIRELCVFDGIFEAGAKLAVLRTRAVEQYIVQYMKAFATAGYHIVHSTPIYGADAEFGWTSVDFRVVSRTTVTVTNVTHKHEAPVIVVVGMSHDKPMPMITTIEWHAGLVIRSKRTSYGTAMLASKSFLERAILSRLELVNKMTTVVPRFPKAEEEEWKVSLLAPLYMAQMVLTWRPGLLVHVERALTPCVVHLTRSADAHHTPQARTEPATGRWSRDRTLFQAARWSTPGTTRMSGRTSAPARSRCTARTMSSARRPTASTFRPTSGTFGNHTITYKD
jgi:hypothetical protein